MELAWLIRNLSLIIGGTYFLFNGELTVGLLFVMWGELSQTIHNCKYNHD